jgi:hypothetical protein
MMYLMLGFRNFFNRKNVPLILVASFVMRVDKQSTAGQISPKNDGKIEGMQTIMRLYTKDRKTSSMHRHVVTKKLLY